MPTERYRLRYLLLENMETSRPGGMWGTGRICVDLGVGGGHGDRNVSTNAHPESLAPLLHCACPSMKVSINPRSQSCLIIVWKAQVLELTLMPTKLLSSE